MRLGANTVAAIATDDVTATEEVATADVIITPAPSSSTSAQATKTASLQEIGAVSSTSFVYVDFDPAPYKKGQKKPLVCVIPCHLPAFHIFFLLACSSLYI